MTQLSAIPVLKHAYAYWNSAILAATLKHGFFTALEKGEASPSQLAERIGIPVRSVQAMLDALLGMELVELADGRYRNTAHASAFLVRGAPEYLGGYADVILATWRDWEQLPGIVAVGKPLHRHENADPNNAFWEPLVTALAPLSFPPARAAALRVGLQDMEAPQILDIGGGAGAFSATWLQLNPKAVSTQIDWPNVNRIAARYVAELGVVERFKTIDADMEKVALEDSHYDFAIYANVAHGLAAERNIAMFQKIHKTLKPGGRLIIVGLLPNDDRTGNPLLLMFNSNMLLNTDEGSIHLRGEYVSWLQNAGFSAIEFEPVKELPFTIVYATK